MRIAIVLLVAAAMPAAAQTQAEKLIAAGHWKRARALVDPRQTQDARTQFLLSQIDNAFGDRQSPLQLAERAVALDGRVARYHRQLAEVTGVMAEHAGVVQQFLLARRFRHEIEITLALDPRDLQALRDLMEFYLLAPGIAGGDKGKARATAERIARLDAVHGYLAEARLEDAAGDRAREEAALRQAVSAGPADYGARIALAKFLLARGDVGGARQEAEAAMNIDGSRVDSYSVLASLYADRGATSELDAVLVLAEKQVPDDLAPYYWAADILSSKGRDLERAERYFARYLSTPAEGNEPTLSEARGKLAGMRANRPVSATHAMP